MSTAGNIANLNINITSNVSKAISDLSKLESKLSSLGRMNLTPNISGITNSLGKVSNLVNDITKGFKNLGNITPNISSGLNIGTEGITNITGTNDALLNLVATNSLLNNTTRNTPRRPIEQFMPGPKGPIDVTPKFKDIFYNMKNFKFNLDAFPGNTVKSLVGDLFKDINTASVNAVSSGFNRWNTTLSSVGGKLQSIASAVSKVLIGVTAIGAAFVAILKKGIDFNAEMEQIKTSFDVLTKGTTNYKITMDGAKTVADDLFLSLEQFAKVTPFETKELANSAQLLLNYGVAAKDVLPVISMLGDTSLGNSEKFQRMSVAFGQVFATGRLQGQDLNQMIQSGFNPLQELSDMTGKSMGSLKSDMEDGKIGVDMVIQAFQRATSEGGKFYGMMTEQSKTFSGKWSTVADTIDIGFGKVTKQLFEDMKIGIQKVIDVLDRLNIDELADSVNQNVIPAFYALGIVALDAFDLNEPINTTKEGMDKITKGIGNLIMDVVVLAVAFGKIFSAIKLVWDGCMLFFQGIGKGLNIVLSIVFGVAEGIVRSLGDALSIVVKGFKNGSKMIGWALTDGIQWGLNKVLDSINSVSDYINGVIGKDILGKVSFRFEVSEMPKLESITDDLKGLKDAWGSNTGFGMLMNELKDTSITDRIKAIGSDLSSIFSSTDTKGVKSFVDSMDKLKTIEDNKKEKDKKDKIDSNNSTKEDEDKKAADDKVAKEKKDAEDKVKYYYQIGDAINEASDSLAKFGKVFDKVSYEKFSPSKMINRIIKQFKEMSNWSKNLESLSSKGIDDSIISELRGMGQSGYGITAGLAKANNSQLKQIMGNWQSIRGLAVEQAQQKVQYEHTGTITVKGITTEGEVKAVAAIVADDLVTNEGRNPSRPTLARTFK